MLYGSIYGAYHVGIVHVRRLLGRLFRQSIRRLRRHAWNLPGRDALRPQRRVRKAPRSGQIPLQGNGMSSIFHKIEKIVTITTILGVTMSKMRISLVISVQSLNFTPPRPTQWSRDFIRPIPCTAIISAFLLSLD